MEKTIDCKQLYALQDEVLAIVFALENSFYLTGGTALHRFYYKARYSDGLDFFTGSDDLFGESINEILDMLEEKYSLNHSVKAKDFHRIIVNDSLQLDFVNDIVYRHVKSNIIGDIRVDNKVNILANKVTAIIGRDEAKDVFDLFYIARHEEFSWTDILHIANKKAMIEKEILLNRLSSFPLKWLETIKTIEHFEINKETIKQLCNDILIGRNNSLYKPK